MMSLFSDDFILSNISNYRIPINTRFVLITVKWIMNGWHS